MAGIALALLFLQFLLGMWLNLFASFPTSSFNQSGFGGMMSIMMGFMMTGGMSVLMIHMMLGYALFIVSILVFAFAIGSKEQTPILLGAAGVASVTIAGLGGLGFMFSGFQNDFFSYIMAVGFLSAFVTYLTALSFLGVGHGDTNL
ncbi:MAG: hypothetical protein JRN54_08510, partial [Nitrososphaerota archaeon]|nr:hypothetical protein [Nitrososphaerota archaeon]